MEPYAPASIHRMYVNTEQHHLSHILVKNVLVRLKWTWHQCKSKLYLGSSPEQELHLEQELNSDSLLMAHLKEPFNRLDSFTDVTCGGMISLDLCSHLKSAFTGMTSSICILFFVLVSTRILRCDAMRVTDLHSESMKHEEEDQGEVTWGDSW